MKIAKNAVPQPEQQPLRSAAAAAQEVKNAVPTAAPAKAATAAVAQKALVLPAVLGLPADGLSAAVVAFAKYFSLPLVPRLLAHIRQQALAGTARETAANGAAPAAGEGGAVAANREALSAAATAATAKGVELTAAALEKYAAAIDPETAAAVDADARQGGGQTPSGQEQQNGQKKPEQNPLLDIVNRLPGRDGRRWVVLPFSFANDGGQYRVSVRILLDENAPKNQSGKLAVDIAKSGNGNRGERWLFVMDSANGQNPRMEVFVQPSRPAKRLAALRAGLSVAMGIPIERVAVQNQAGRFAAAAECRQGLPRSVDEEA